MMKKHKKVLLAYSGGLDTSLLIPWLVKQGYEVVAVTGDLGQKEDLEEVRERALKAGAAEAVVVDLKREFAEEFVAEAVRFNGLYEDAYPLGTALARYPLARALVQEARKREIGLIAHGCTGKGNDQLRFELSIRTLAPDIDVWAPMRDWGATRLQLLELAEELGIEVPATPERPYSVDENLWSRSVEGGVLEDPLAEPPEEVFAWTFNPDSAMRVEVSLSFKDGVPVALNGEEMPLWELVWEMNALAGSAGVGRIDHMESRVIGLKSREVYEAPAAVAILKAHKWLEKAVLPGPALSEKAFVDRKLAELTFAGLWFTPLTKAFLAFERELSKFVEGTVYLRMEAGRVDVVKVESPRSLYSKEAVSYESTSLDPRWSEGFIRLFGLAWEKVAENGS